MALAVRWNHIVSQPFDFQGARQWHSAAIARDYYVSASDAPRWKERVARAAVEEDPPIELPINEYAAAIAYRLYGGERLWIPRLLSSLYWIAGSLFLYLVAARFVPRWAALIAVAVNLFLPFAVVASTSFQPDPVMVMLLVAAILAIVRHHEQRTKQRFVAALAVSGAAVLVKPGVAAFFVLPLFVALAIVRDGGRGALTKASTYAFLALSSLPIAALYAYSVGTGEFLSRQAEQKINARLLGDSFYWRGWFDNPKLVLRPPFFTERLSLVVA